MNDFILKDKPDSRDYIYKLPVSIEQSKLPSKVDHRIYAGNIENQGRTSSCVANATVSALEILLQRTNSFVDLSRLFLYYNLRSPYLNLNENDVGSYLRDAFKDVSKNGICSENIWPFIESKVNTKPDELSYKDALLRLCTRYERVLWFGKGDLNNANILKYVLAKGHPIVIGMNVSLPFMSLKGDLASQNYPGVNGNSIGGHAMCIVGYDDSIGSFIVENSWGTVWGDNGYGAIKYQVMVNDVEDCWICTEFAGHRIEDEFILSVIPITVQNERTVFNYTNNKRDYNKYCLAQASGGVPPYSYEFINPFFGTLQAISSNPYFYYNKTIPIGISAPYDDHIICCIRDSAVPYQMVCQSFVTHCTPDPITLDITSDAIISLYTAFFNRVPLKTGLNYWLTSNDTNMLVISDIFYQIAINDNIYPKSFTNANFVTLLFKNLFNRAPLEGGLKYWVSALDSGSITHGGLTLALINGAWGPSKIFLDNKIEVSRQFVKRGMVYNLNKITEDVATVKAAIAELLST